MTAQSTSQFDLALAIELGQLANYAYTIAEPPPGGLPLPPDGYELTHHVWMTDFIFEPLDAPSLYGFLARHTGGTKPHVLAIRGTVGWIEWWDDFASLGLVPFANAAIGFQGPGHVGYGFQQIFNSFRLLPVGTKPGPNMATTTLTEAPNDFVDQVASAIRETASSQTLTVTPGIRVVGHSLGSALVTLYTLQNLLRNKVAISEVYTFASPRVGDGTFAQAFTDEVLDKAQCASWRIANDQDIVTYMPPYIPFIAEFTHVQTLYVATLRNDVRYWNPACAHSIPSYLNALDPSIPPTPACFIGDKVASLSKDATPSGSGSLVRSNAF